SGSVGQASITAFSPESKQSASDSASPDFGDCGKPLGPQALGETASNPSPSNPRPSTLARRAPASSAGQPGNSVAGPASFGCVLRMVNRGCARAPNAVSRVLTPTRPGISDRGCIRSSRPRPAESGSDYLRPHEAGDKALPA